MFLLNLGLYRLNLYLKPLERSHGMILGTGPSSNKRETKHEHYTHFRTSHWRGRDGNEEAMYATESTGRVILGTKMVTSPSSIEPLIGPTEGMNNVYYFRGAM